MLLIPRFSTPYLIAAGGLASGSVGTSDATALCNDS